jgi:hypothetical protein
MTLIEPVLREEIARHVQDVLNRHQPHGYRVEVDSDAVLKDDEWYHVVVVTSPRDVRDREFYDALAQAESELNDQNDGHQYLLVPAIAD